jgi:WD40-like Beta Propeller Repeat
VTSRLRTAVVGAFLVSLMVAAPAHATFPGANGKIAYQNDTIDGPEIHVIDQDGTNDLNLGTGQEPSWSPDGTRIAYRDAGLWLMNADGTGKHAILTDNANGSVINPAWSPAADKLVFVREACQGSGSAQTCSSTLNTVNPDGTGETTIVRDQPPHPLHPVWSSDGTLIIFTKGSTYPDSCSGGIYTVDPDGTHVATLTDGNGACDPDSSPDSHKFLWSANGGTTWSSRDRSTWAQVGHGFVEAVWSPDGTKIVARGDCCAFSPYSIYVMNADGTAPKLLTNQIAIDSEPNWQPITRNYARPRGASPFLAYLVPSYNRCASPNSTHGSPLAFGSCSPPQPPSGFLTMGTPDANQKAPQGLAAVVLTARPADLRIDVGMRDIRKGSDLSDYTGEVQLFSNVRITDRNNTPNPGGPGPATLQDRSFVVPFSCTATASTSIGSDCNISTSVNALYPGAIVANQRAIWQLGEVQVYDGGPDGLVSTPIDNSLFLNQGLFVP